MSIKLLFVDVETTGLDPLTHEIASLAFVVAEEAEDGSLYPIGQFNGRLRCHCIGADKEALRVNGFTMEDLQAAPAPVVALSALAAYPDAVIVGHNLLFDLEFLRDAYRRESLAFPGWKYKVDTMGIAHALRVAGRINPLKLSLDGLAAYFDARPRLGDTHDALEDVFITVEIYTKLVEVLSNGDRYVPA